MIRKAVKEDLKDIMKIIRETIVEMHSYNNYQWDDNYPQEKDFAKDIEKGDLYVIEEERELRGFACINKEEPEEYTDINWSLDEERLVLHRMAVSSSYRQMGIGSNLINFADELASENNIRYLKTDTYSLNTKMNAFFMKSGYKLVGEMRFLGKEKPFYCYEKVLKV